MLNFRKKGQGMIYFDKDIIDAILILLASINDNLRSIECKLNDLTNNATSTVKSLKTANKGLKKGN